MWLYASMDDEGNTHKYHYGLMQSNHGDYIGVRRYFDKANEVITEEGLIHKDSLLMPFVIFFWFCQFKNDLIDLTDL